MSALTSPIRSTSTGASCRSSEAQRSGAGPRLPVRRRRLRGDPGLFAPAVPPRRAPAAPAGNAGRHPAGQPATPTRNGRAVVARLIVARNRWDDQSVYLQVTRGADDKRDHAFPQAAWRRRCSS
ncbi:MAG: hypothetical protein MZW92_00380 [Comamonadaceae bacterium]|nr:hypothetical protein [Comamonadaceae bacterium]